MRKALFSTIIVFAAALFLSACDDFYTSDNGRLDGFWQLTSIDSLNGKTADMRERLVFWGVQTDLLEMRDLTGEHISVFFRYKFTGSELILSSPVANNRRVSDSLVTDVNTISYYGLSQLNETLQVEHLSSSRMTLLSERMRLYFRKY